MAELPEEFDGLEQRQQMFAQLGTFIDQMSQETGSVDVWRNKLAELERLRVRVSELEGDLDGARRHADIAERSRVAAETERTASRAEIDQLKEALTSEKALTRRLMDDGARWKKAVETAREEAKAAQSAASEAQELRTGCQTLNDELVRTQQSLGEQRTQFEHQVLALGAQLEKVQAEKAEVRASRRILGPLRRSVIRSSTRSVTRLPPVHSCRPSSGTSRRTSRR